MNAHHADRIKRLQDWLKRNALHGFIVPSTDEYLSEFTPPACQRLRWLTGFRGLVGQAIVSQDAVALFVDGRYTLQAQLETSALDVQVLPLSDSSQESWLATHLHSGERLSLDPTLHPFQEIERMRGWALGSGVEMVMLTENPLDALWGDERPSVRRSNVYAYPLTYAGASFEEKRAAVCRALVEGGLHAYLITDPEDLAWLLNVRADDWPLVPVCLSHALLEASGRLTWLVDASRLAEGTVDCLGDEVAIAPPAQLEEYLTRFARGKRVGANLRRTPWKWAAIIARVGVIRDDTLIELRRWKKHPREVEGARRAHYLDGQAIIRFLAWLDQVLPDRRVTELDAAARLTEFRALSSEYRGPSMPLMSASGPSSALPHYVPDETHNLALNDHPIYWIDSGGQYICGTTDNTVAVALGEAEPKHKLAHTLVLKGFIAMAMLRFPRGTLASQLDSVARRYLWEHGMDYVHGTGHGVGSFMSIHQGPIISKNAIHTAFNSPVEASMILSNEPGYYAAGDFGFRIESHVLTVPSPTHEGFLEFETLSRLPIDPDLVDRALLSPRERQWLADYHRRIWADYGHVLDDFAAGWLKQQLEPFVND